MRTRVLAIAALLLAAGCGDEPAPASDRGQPTAPEQSEATGAPTEDLASAFRAFARGGAPPATAEEVQLYLGNALTGVVGARDATDRRAWATCTEVGSYAGRSCPLSPLAVLRQHDAVDRADRPRGPCLPRFGPVPADLRELERTVLVPSLRGLEPCADNFAVQLFADDDGRLVAVSTLLGERGGRPGGRG